MNGLCALNGCFSYHGLIIFEQRLLTEGLTASETHGLKIHFLLFWPLLLENRKFFLNIMDFFLLLLMVVLDLHPKWNIHNELFLIILLDECPRKQVSLHYCV